MSRVKDVMKIASDYLRLQERLFYEMESLDGDEFVEFMKWYGGQICDFLKSQMAHPPRNTTTHDATSS